MGFFTLLLVAPALLVAWALAFIIARRLQPTSVALRIASLFIVGSVCGAIVAVGVFALLVGPDTTLPARWHVIAFLTALVFASLLAGALLLWASIKLRVLTLRSTRPARQAAQSG